jgi:hypothetical protein
MKSFRKNGSVMTLKAPKSILLLLNTLIYSFEPAYNPTLGACDTHSSSRITGVLRATPIDTTTATVAIGNVIPD